MKKNKLFLNIEKEFKKLIEKYKDEFEYLVNSGTSSVSVFFPKESHKLFSYNDHKGFPNSHYLIGCNQFSNSFEGKRTYFDNTFSNSEFFELCEDNNICSIESLYLEIDVKNKKLSYSNKNNSIKTKKAAVILFDIIFSKMKNKRFLEISNNEKIKESINYKTYNNISSLVSVNLNQKEIDNISYNVNFFVNNNSYSKNFDISIELSNYIFDRDNFKKIALTIIDGRIDNIKISKNYKEENIKNYEEVIKAILNKLTNHYDNLNNNKNSW